MIHFLLEQANYRIQKIDCCDTCKYGDTDTSYECDNVVCNYPYKKEKYEKVKTTALGYCDKFEEMPE